jgi:isoamylase
VRNEHGEPIIDETYLLLFNAHHESRRFVLPGKLDVTWSLLVDTAEETGFIETPRLLQAGQALKLMDRSLCVLHLIQGEESSVTSP